MSASPATQDSSKKPPDLPPPPDPGPSTSSRGMKKKEEEVADSTFCFESDQLVLRGNQDYCNLMKTLTTLLAQRSAATRDLEKLLKLKSEVKKDASALVESLRRGEKLDIGGAMRIAELPSIDWSKYNNCLPCPTSTRPVTRLASGVVTQESGTFKTTRPRPNGGKATVQRTVRGRPYDDSKPETFNQPWSVEEQRRLEELLMEYPPEDVEMRRWEKVARALGNRTSLQVQSRVQKYFLKLQRLGLPIPGKLKPLPVQKKQRSNNHLWKPSTFLATMSTYDAFPPYTYTASPKVEQRSSNSPGFQIRAPQGQLAGKHPPTPVVNKEEEYQCDGCGATPIPGTRWNCGGCPDLKDPTDSVDFCPMCVIHSPKAQPHWAHSLKATPESIGSGNKKSLKRKSCLTSAGSM